MTNYFNTELNDYIKKLGDDVDVDLEHTICNKIEEELKKIEEEEAHAKEEANRLEKERERTTQKTETDLIKKILITKPSELQTKFKTMKFTRATGGGKIKKGGSKKRRKPYKIRSKKNRTKNSKKLNYSLGKIKTKKN